MTASAKTPSLSSVPELLGQTWELYKTNFRLLIGYSAWMLVPLVISVLITVAFGSEGQEVNEFVTGLLNLFVFTWLSIIFILITLRLASEKKVKIRSMSAQAWKVFVPYLLLLVLKSIAVGVGFLLLIVPGLILSIWWLFADMTLISKGTGVIDSLKQSRELVRGRWWPVFGRNLGGILTIAIIYIVILAVIMLILSAVFGGDPFSFLDTPATLMETVIVQIMDILFVPLFVMYVTLLYKNVLDTPAPNVAE